MKVYITRNKNSDDNLDNLIFIWLKKPEKREGEGCFVDGDKNFIEYGSIRPNSYGSFLFKPFSDDKCYYFVVSSGNRNFKYF